MPLVLLWNKNNMQMYLLRYYRMEEPELNLSADRLRYFSREALRCAETIPDS